MRRSASGLQSGLMPLKGDRDDDEDEESKRKDKSPGSADKKVSRKSKRDKDDHKHRGKDAHHLYRHKTIDEVESAAVKIQYHWTQRKKTGQALQRVARRPHASALLGAMNNQLMDERIKHFGMSPRH